MSRHTLVAAVLVLATCHDRAPGVVDAPASDGPTPDATAGLPYVELPTISGYNHASETLVAASGSNVVVVTTDQAFPSADSFAIPTVPDNDPAHPFRKVVFATSHDLGATFSAPRSLVVGSCTDPLIASSVDGSFWAGCNNPDLSMPHADLLHSTDGGDTFVVVASPMISDKAWIAVDEPRHAVWMTGFRAFRLFGFDGSELAALDTPTSGITGSFADAAGLHFMTDNDDFQMFTWNGVDPPTAEGMPLEKGDMASLWTTADVSMGDHAPGQWVVRAIRDTVLGSPIVIRTRSVGDPGHDVAISPPGTIGFLPAATLDPDGRLHVVWYDSSGPTGQLMYSRSATADLQGGYTTPVVIDGNACPGGGWYPYDAGKNPPGGRRLREYVGIAITGNHALISWTHAPEAPSRIRIAHIDF